jgi:hypothetical protein
MKRKGSAVRNQVFRFIIQYKRDHDGLSPSIQEIADALFMSRTNAWYHRVMLEREGRIRVTGRRSIEVLAGKWELSENAPGESRAPEANDDQAAPTRRPARR